jgi:hypothetical protein
MAGTSPAMTATKAVKHHRSRDAAGIRGMGQAARKRHEASLFERSRSEAGGGVRPFIPIQARKAKKETRKKQERKKKERKKKEKRKKEGGTPADA